MIDMLVMLHVGHLLQPVGHGHGEQAEMADQFIEPAQLLSRPRDHPMHRLMRGQEAGHDVHASNRESDPQREDIEEHQWPERQPDQHIAETPDWYFPRKAIGIFAGDHALLSCAVRLRSHAK